MNNQEPNQDYKNVNAEVIGELRKDKIGKPSIAIVMIFLFAIVIISLPLFTKLMEDENSFVYKIFNKDTQTTTPVNTEDKYTDAKEIQLLNANTKMMYNNLLIMKNFTINSDSIDCVMSSYNSLLTLDNQEYYLEIYSNNNEKVTYVKLLGSYDNSETNVKLENNFSFNGTKSYYGKIVFMNDSDYPEVTLNSDESGLATMSCTNTNEVINYDFKNGYLIKINDTVNVNFENNTNYQNDLESYRTKATNLGSIASVNENTTGFTFNANIDLESYHVPSSVTDYNYYELDSEAKIIKYNLEGKGFECK